MRGACVFQRGQRNNHACTYKFTRLQNTHDSYTSRSYVCAIYQFLVLSVCELRLVTQLYKSNATSALVAGYGKIYCYRRICQCCATGMPKPYTCI